MPCLHNELYPYFTNVTGYRSGEDHPPIDDSRVKRLNWQKVTHWVDYQHPEDGCWDQRREAVSEQIDRHPEIASQSPLFKAALTGDFNEVKRLVEVEHVDVNQPSTIRRIIASGVAYYTALDAAMGDQHQFLDYSPNGGLDHEPIAFATKAHRDIFNYLAGHASDKTKDDAMLTAHDVIMTEAMEILIAHGVKADALKPDGARHGFLVGKLKTFKVDDPAGTINRFVERAELAYSQALHKKVEEELQGIPGFSGQLAAIITNYANERPVEVLVHEKEEGHVSYTYQLIKNRQSAQSQRSLP